MSDLKLRALFGSAVTSPTTVMNVLANKFGCDSVIMHDQAPTKATKFVMFLSTNNLKQHHGKFNNQLVGIVFDSPINLQGIDKIVYIDINKRPSSESLSYKFALVTPDYAKIVRAVKKNTEFTYSRNQLDLMPHIISNRANGEFIENLNNFVYSSTSHENRRVIKNQTIDFFFNHNKADKYGKQLSKAVEMNPIRVILINKIIDYCKSEKGKMLISVCKEAWKQQASGTKIAASGKKAAKSILYNSYVKKFGINKIDLKTLIAMHREKIINENIGGTDD